jgi:serine protease Do
MSLQFSLACLSLVCVAPSSDSPGLPQPSPLDVVSALESVVADAIAKAEPSVVAIHRFKDENSQETLAVRGKTRRTNGLAPRGPRGRLSRDRELADQLSFDFGSGVVVGNEGQILTTFHVVQGASQLIVRAAERQVFDAEIIAADPRSDLAVITPVEVPGVEPSRLKPIPLGDAGQLRKGAFLVVLGNPFNAARDGKPSASWGILSNLARRLEPEVDELMMFQRRFAQQLPNYPTLLQLDAKLNLGMSGGAVVNMKGELVGLTTTAASPSGFDAMAGYAFPMDRIGRRAVETLKQGKEIEYGLLGIRADPGGSNRVGNVYPDTPAAQGELQINDEIIGVNDLPVTDFDSLILAVNSFAPGEEIRLTIRRETKRLEKTVVLAKFPVDGEVIATNRPGPWRGLRVDYVSTVHARFPAPNFPELSSAGVVVTEVQENSPAARAGIKKGQVIRQVDKKTVRNPVEFENAVADFKGPVTLLTDLGSVTVP